MYSFRYSPRLDANVRRLERLKVIHLLIQVMHTSRDLSGPGSITFAIS